MSAPSSSSAVRTPAISARAARLAQTSLSLQKAAEPSTSKTTKRVAHTPTVTIRYMWMSGMKYH